jgi:hypothetical protein
VVRGQIFVDFQLCRCVEIYALQRTEFLIGYVANFLQNSGHDWRLPRVTSAQKINTLLNISVPFSGGSV